MKKTIRASSEFVKDVGRKVGVHSRNFVKGAKSATKQATKATKNATTRAKTATRHAAKATNRAARKMIHKGEEFILDYGEKIINATHDQRFRKWFKALSTTFLILSMVLFVYVLFNYQLFEEKINDAVIIYGNFGIFIISFVLDLLLIPLGPDVPIAIGILANLPWPSVFFMATLGSFLASFLGYYVGTLYGEHGMVKMYGTIKYLSWKKTFEKYGKWAVFLGAVTPVPYVPMCWLSGIFKFSMRDFIIYALIPRAIRFIIVVLLVLSVM